MSSAAPFTESKQTESKEKESGVNIQVVVRCRPLSEREKGEGETPIVTVSPASNEISVVTTLKRSKTYTFDKVFGQYSTQEEVFGGSIVPIIDEVLTGFNCTVFAYGQTGTGKTHTMEGEMGSGPNAGVIPRALHMIFDKLQRTASEYSVRLSFLELYNEQLEDLMANDENECRPASGAGSYGRCDPAAAAAAKREEAHRLKITDDPRKGTVVHGLEEVPVKDSAEAFELLNAAIRKRRVAETLMNKASSRSHSIFTVTLHMKESTAEGEDLVKVGKLNLVDLAGSECVGRSGAKNERLREAGNINQSLLTLGRVINALVDHSLHVPYRDSKLTRLLQDSLGGRTKTCIIATLSPSLASVEESLSTLDYANRAKDIKNRPQQNQRLTKRALIREYTQEIERLREELKCAREKNGIFLPPERYDEMQRSLAAQSGSIKELEELLGAHKSECDGLKAQVELARASLEEFKIIAAAHQSTEVALTREATEVASALVQTVTDVHLLHDKISRKAAVEQDNKSASGSFVDSASQQLDTLQAAVSQYKLQQQQRVAGLQYGLSSLTSQISSQSASLSSRVAAVGGSVDAMVEHGLLSCKAFFTGTQGQYTALQDQVTAFEGSFGDMMVTSGSEIKKELAGLSQLLQKQQEQLNFMCKLVTDFTSVASESTAAFAHKHSATVNACKQSVTDLMTSAQARMDAHALKVQEFAQHRASAAAALAEAVSQTLAAYVSSESLAAQTQAKDITADLAVTAKALESGTSAVRDTISDLGTGTGTWADAHTSSLSSLSDAVDTAAVGMAGTVSECEGFRSELETKIDAQLTQTSADVGAVLKSFGGTIAAAEAQLGKFITALCDDFTSSKSAVIAETETVTADVASFADSLKGHCTKISEQVGEVDMAVTATVGEHTSWIEHMRAEHAAYITEGIKTDVPTGLTPAKRDYPSPPVFTATLPHDALLAAHKAALTAATPVKRSDVKISLLATPA